MGVAKSWRLLSRGGNCHPLATGLHILLSLLSVTVIDLQFAGYNRCFFAKISFIKYGLRLFIVLNISNKQLQIALVNNQN